MSHIFLLVLTCIYLVSTYFYYFAVVKGQHKLLDINLKGASLTDGVNLDEIATKLGGTPELTSPMSAGQHTGVSVSLMDPSIKSLF